MTGPAVRPSHRANRLIDATSPYLLQHAYNPVDWHAWGDEAFQLARAQDKAIFLSIGYSTCYWCHVMERECFENAAIAEIMNELFICIKVDREQRPDVDDLYMTGVQLLTGSGGWPMSMFLEPQSLKPFYGGTYFPPEDRYGRPGFPTVLRSVANAWKTNRVAVIEQSQAVADAIEAQHAVDAQPVAIGKPQVEEAIASVMASYDRIDGGFGAGAVGGRRAPKFPQPSNIDLLLATAWERPGARRAVHHTLDRMAIGGMFDQVGGGFHRYCVDEKWLVPHFEKMLYDNAQLASTYLRAFERSGDAFYASIAQRTLDYVLREMTSSDGAFFSAQDAEVNALEGGNYLWTPDEVRTALSAAGKKDLAALALDIYGLDRGTNFQDPHHPESAPSNVLFLSDRPDRLAVARGIPLETIDASIASINSALLYARDKREQPSTDDKILAGWNGLMIAAMADGGRVLNQPKYVHAAQRAADFVLTRMQSSGGDGGGGLMRSYRQGRAQIGGFLEDHAFMIHGLLALHRIDASTRWLDQAAALALQANDRFRDDIGGGYFDAQANQSDLFARIKSVHDGAVPSGNSVMLLNLLDLHDRTGDERWLADAKAAMSGLSSAVARSPAGCVLAVVALHRMDRANQLPPSHEVAETKSKDDKVTATLSPHEVHIDAGMKARIEVVIAIAPGWHINSHAPGEANFMALTVELAGCEGLRIQPQYPQGVRLKIEGAAADILVYTGMIRVPVMIEQWGEIMGQPQLVVAYQACDDRSCQQPQRVVLDLRVVTPR